jgi:hypothetical protein
VIWSIRCGTKRAGRKQGKTFIYPTENRYFSGNFYWRTAKESQMVMRMWSVLKLNWWNLAFARYHPWWREIWN